MQGEPVKLADPKGRVTVVHFWTNGCINCVHNYPLYRAWGERHTGRPLRIVGVHTPEFASEAAAETVKARLAENKLTFPVVLDTDKSHLAGVGEPVLAVPSTWWTRPARCGTSGRASCT